MKYYVTKYAMDVSGIVPGTKYIHNKYYCVYPKCTVLWLYCHKIRFNLIRKKNMKRFKIIYKPPCVSKLACVMLSYKAPNFYSPGGYVFTCYKTTFNQIRLKHQV